jgi:hypothetical protein
LLGAEEELALELEDETLALTLLLGAEEELALELEDETLALTLLLGAEAELALEPLLNEEELLDESPTICSPFTTTLVLALPDICVSTLVPSLVTVLLVLDGKDTILSSETPFSAIDRSFVFSASNSLSLSEICVIILGFSILPSTILIRFS